MARPLQFSFALKTDDFAQAIRGFQINQANERFSTMLFALFIGAGILGLVRNGIELSILGFVVLGSLGLIYSYVVFPALAASRLAQDHSSVGENHWSVTQDQFNVHTAEGDVNLGWKFFQGYVELKRMFLLIYSQNKRSFQVIPKRAFESPAQEAEFRQLLRDKFEKDRKPFVVRNWRIILIGLLVLLANIYAMYILGKNR